MAITWTPDLSAAEWEEMIRERAAEFEARCASLIESLGVACPSCGLYTTHCRSSLTAPCCRSNDVHPR